MHEEGSEGSNDKEPVRETRVQLEDVTCKVWAGNLDTLNIGISPYTVQQ